MILFSDRGTPDGVFNQHGYSGHTFKWCKDDGSFVYVQVHCRADRGFKVLRQSNSCNILPNPRTNLQTLDGDTATRLAGENPDYSTEQLFNTIEKGEYPSWTVYIVSFWRHQTHL